MGRRRLRHSVLVCSLTVAACLSCAFSVRPQSRSDEYKVKASYLYNFGKFVHWPPATTKDPNFVICIIGSDPFGRMLDAAVAGEKINDRSLMARRIAAPQEASACHILFISASEAGRLADILNVLDRASVLTVSDIPGFTANGGMIQFVLQENKVRFEVNMTAAEAARLTFSSQLLKVATNIRREPRSAGKPQ